MLPISEDQRSQPVLSNPSATWLNTLLQGEAPAPDETFDPYWAEAQLLQTTLLRKHKYELLDHAPDYYEGHDADQRDAFPWEPITLQANPQTPEDRRSEVDKLLDLISISGKADIREVCNIRNMKTYSRQRSAQLQHTLPRCTFLSTTINGIRGQMQDHPDNNPPHGKLRFSGR